MILAECLPQTDAIQTSNTMIETVINDEMTKLPAVSSESTSINDNCCSITAIKIPLVSFEPILATSPRYILVNERTKRKNQIVLFDEHLQKSITRSLINENILDALWYDNQQYFLLLTPTNIFIFDPNTMSTNLLDDIIPIKNKQFKCFTLLNQSTLLIAYEEWNGEHIDKWQQDNNGNWILIQRQSLKLTSNEFIGNILTVMENNMIILALTIYNILTEQWRIEFRNIDTFLCYKTMLLPGTNIMHDYRIIFTKDVESDVKWLVFSSKNANIIAIDSQWNKTQVNYKYPVRRMAIFNNNYLIVRTRERIDIHLFK